MCRLIINSNLVYFELFRMWTAAADVRHNIFIFDNMEEKREKRFHRNLNLYFFEGMRNAFIILKEN